MATPDHDETAAKADAREAAMGRSRRTSSQVERERWRILLRLEEWLEGPMVVLGFVWLVLLSMELIWGVHPLLEHVGTAIWIAFILDFALRFTLAPRKRLYLRRNWLTLIALALPGLRVLRAARLLRAVRGLRLVRILTSVNRGMRALGRTMRRRGFVYVASLTALVTLVGAAGMYAFERGAGPEGLEDYGDALWWTGMIMTSLGSEYWPRTPEGRILAFVLSVYAVAVFGYLTASLASFFIGRDAESAAGEVAGEAALRALRQEVSALREEIRALSARDGAQRANPEPPVEDR